MKSLLITSMLAGALLSSTSLADDSPIHSAAAAQPEETKARYQYRHPVETLEFFGIEPGMTVVEALPGNGWYSKILLSALGPDGELIGADYPQALWPNFDFMTPERIEAKKTWVTDWTADAQEWRNEESAKVSAFQFNEMPKTMHGTVDAVLFIRALHNLSRFEAKDGFLTDGLKEIHAALKPGGIVGVVQHEAREDRPDEWSDGSNGYLKKSALKAKMKEMGFEFIEESTINENPKDQAGEGDIVWRLPPSLSGSKDDAEKKAAMEAIGESHRMTLKFRKPTE